MCIDKVLRDLFEAGKVAGSAIYKQSKTVCVVLSGQFVYSVMKTDRVCLFRLFMHEKKKKNFLV